MHSLQFICGIFLAYLVLPSIASDVYPLGVNFGPKYITAAYINSPGDPVPLVKKEGNADYQAYMNKAIQDSLQYTMMFGEYYIKNQTDKNGKTLVPEGFPKYRPETKEIFVSILQDIKDIATQSLGHETNTTTASFPTVLQENAREMIRQGILDSNAADPEAWWQMRGNTGANYRAYAELENRKVEDKHVFLVDYHGDRLCLVEAEVDGDIFDPGEPVWVDDDNNTTTDTVSPRHKRAIREFFTQYKFLERTEEIEGVILSGEASPAAMDEMRRFLNEFIPADSKGLIKDTLDPMFVSAIGTAYRGRYFLQNPDEFDDKHLCDCCPDLYAHDEL